MDFVPPPNITGAYSFTPDSMSGVLMVSVLLLAKDGTVVTGL